MAIDRDRPARNALLQAAEAAGHDLAWERTDFFQPGGGQLWCECGVVMTAEHHRTAAMNYLGVPASWRPFVLLLVETIPLMSLADVLELAEAAAAQPPTG